MNHPWIRSLLLAMVIGGVASPALAYVRIGNCDKVAHTVIAEIAGERSEIHLAPGAHYQTFGWPVRFLLDAKEPRGYITSRNARQLDEYCIWDGEIRFQRRRTAIWR